MKKLLGTFLLCGLGFTTAFASTPTKATINFIVHGKLNSGTFLYQLKDGEPVSLGWKKPDAKGTFSFDVDVKEGIFFFKKAGAHGLDFNYTIYLKGGEQKNVDIFMGKYDFDSCSVVKPNAETKVLQEWLESMNKYQEEAKKHPFGSSFDKTYHDFQQLSVSFLAKNKTANTYFNSWLADKVYADLQYLRAGNYFRFGRVNRKYDSAAAVQSFYTPLNDKKIIDDERLLRSEHGMEFLDFTFAYWKLNETNATVEQVVANYFSAENAAKITEPNVKVAFLLHKMPLIKKYEDFLRYVEPNKNLFITAEHKTAYNKSYTELGPFAKGNPGYNFELKDVNDKTHTLADFKGKIVVIDVWAMWCAPCLAEKPIMEKIAEEYKDRNDLVFMGISVDGYSKKESWKRFVKTKGFTTIELLTQFDESLFKYYKITGIPRFLIFDREGKIITIDAPRPSNPEFKKIIDETLAAKTVANPLGK